MARFQFRTGRGANSRDATGVGTAAATIPPPAAADAIPHGSEIGGYSIGPQLGRGGMGVVYKAHHIRLDRPAAVKVLTPALAQNDEFRDRFMRESQIAATLVHPSVVTVYDAGDHDGMLYLAMQYIAGTDLANLLELESQIDLVRTIEVTAQVGSALDAAHARGLVHRDVKPANILLDVHRAFLGDFGLTKRLDSNSAGLTGVNQIVGTIDYLAPEQIEGKTLDGRADQYALACVIYQCLAGRPPHPKDSDVAILFAHVKEDPVPLGNVRDDFPVEADEVLFRALDKDPSRRYDSCSDFIRDLAAELGVEAPVLPGQEASSQVVVASHDLGTAAIVRGSLAGMGVVVAEAGGDGGLTGLADRPVDCVIADCDITREELDRLHAQIHTGRQASRPKLLVLVPRGMGEVDHPLRGAADAELAKPFSGMQLALKLRKLLGSTAVRG